MNVKKIMSIFQSFYVDVSIEELTLTLPISFVKRFEYIQTFLQGIIFID